MLCAAAFAAPSWSAVDQVLQAGIDNGAYPGCVALVGTHSGHLYAKAFGNYTYGAIPPLNHENPPMALDTLFDMASCTKVSGATNAIAQFYQRGELDLHTPISHFLGPAYNSHGKESITVLNCLLHNAGYPPDPSPNYWFPAFGCPETFKEHPEENFSCQQRIFESLLVQTLENPVGATYVYSDLSFITLQYVVGKLARDLNYVQPHMLKPECLAIDYTTDAALPCYFEAYTRTHVFEALGMANTDWLPPPTVWPNCAPAENDTVYLRRVIQGQVSDGNAYALGGIAGHAGLFSNAMDMSVMMHNLLFPPEHSDVFLNATTVKFFTTEYNHSQSSRALGWNTNDPTVFDEGWGLSCGTLSSKTFMHLGYTGTQLCGDPVRGVYTIFLTNRVYPTATNEKIIAVRKAFNTAVVDVLDAMHITHE